MISDASDSKEKPRVISKLMQNKLKAANNLKEVCDYRISSISPELAEKILQKIL